MESIMTGGISLNFFNSFLSDPKPFTTKRDVKWGKVYWWSIGILLLILMLILCWPNSTLEQTSFKEKIDEKPISKGRDSVDDPSDETIRQFEEARANANQVHSSLDYLYRPDSTSNGGNRNNPDRNSSMILNRGGADSRTQLLAGTRVTIRLNGNTTIASQGMPVIGHVVKDIYGDSGVAIPSGSKVLGDASFDEDSERASISWRSIILPDGRERPFSAIGVDRNGQVGVSGAIHSDRVKNAVGQTITRFVGAYAAGSMTSGMFGASQGGNSNGIRNAIAQTATDRANAMGENLQKERKWIELQAGVVTVAVLNQPFSFRDAGALNGY